MAVTLGFVATHSDVVTVDTPFALPTVNGKVVTGVYLYVAGTAGDIVWKNAAGDLNYIQNALSGSHHLIGAVEVVSSGTVNGVGRTTTATEMTWYSASIP